MNKWTKNYKKYLKNHNPNLEELEDLYEYRDRQERHFNIMLVCGSIIVGCLIAMLFI